MSAINFTDDNSDFWVEDMKNIKRPYQEPLLNESFTNVIKLACDKLKLDQQVYFLTIDVVEQYICIRENLHEEIDDPFMDMFVIVFTLGKFCGGSHQRVSTSDLKDLMFTISHEHYKRAQILKREQEILAYLDFKLPLNNVLDDLDNVLYKLILDYRLSSVLRPLCNEILVLIYATRQNWFSQLKNLYETEKALFEELIKSRFFIPMTVILCGLKITNYKIILEIEKVKKDFFQISGIEACHFETFSSIIVQFINH